MLALQEVPPVVAELAVIAATPVAYDGFPFWHVLLVEAGREFKTHEWLDEKLKVSTYLPIYSRKTRLRGRANVHRFYPVIPGMLFIPRSMVGIYRRQMVFDLCHIYGVMKTTDGKWATLTKADIELIRRMEGELNSPTITPTAAWKQFTVGQPVKFTDEVYAAAFGGGKIFEIANEGRIGLEVIGLFGRVTRIYVAASGIEAM